MRRLTRPSVGERPTERPRTGRERTEPKEYTSMPFTSAQRGGHGCTICADPNVEAIDAAIKSGAMSRSRIANQFGVSESAVQRHKDKGHVTVSVERLDADTPEIAPASSLDVPQEMLQQFKRTLEAVRLARKQGNLNSIADANREHRQTLDGIGK